MSNRIKYFFLFILLAGTSNGFSQDSSYSSTDTLPAVVDTSGYVAPIYPGGESDMFLYIEKELFLSVSNLIQVNTLGDLFSIRFRVNKFGDVEDAYVASSSNASLNKYLLRIFANMPKWTPGSINGEQATQQMEYQIKVYRLVDGYNVTKTEYNYKRDTSTRTIKTVFMIVSIGLLVYLFTK